MKTTYICAAIGEEKRAIAGGYTAQERVVLPYKDRQVLCILGSVCLDTSCCGSGDWNYIQVIGYLLDTIKLENIQSAGALDIDTIEDPDDRTALRQILAEKYSGARIEFR
jgi:hypothetical protein